MDVPVHVSNSHGPEWDDDEHKGFGPDPFAVEDQCAFWPALQRCLDFLRVELGNSAGMLSSLAAELTREVCGLMDPDEEDSRQLRLVRIHQALQNEDRIQQRIRDLSEVLAALETALAPAASRDDRDLDIVIGRKLRLEELRAAFGSKDGGLGTMSPSSSIPPGDVDLF
jgi:hypothetical protein